MIVGETVLSDPFQRHTAVSTHNKDDMEIERTSQFTLMEGQPRLLERILALPDELLLLVLAVLDTSELLAISKVCSKVRHRGAFAISS